MQVLDVRGNGLSCLEGLTEGVTCLHELYLNHNQFTSLAGLADKAPNLETLVSSFSLHQLFTYNGDMDTAG